VLLGEAGWQRLARELSGAQLLSSVLLALEVERTLVQLSRSGRLTPAELQNALDRLGRDLDQFALRDLTLDLCRSGVMPIVSTPRSLDLAHLRTALWFSPATGADAVREPRRAPEAGGPGARPARLRHAARDPAAAGSLSR
jgi:hypothetical protein